MEDEECVVLRELGLREAEGVERSEPPQIDGFPRLTTDLHDGEGDCRRLGDGEMQDGVSVDVAGCEIVETDGVGGRVEDAEHLHFREQTNHRVDGSLATETLDGDGLRIGSQKERNNRVAFNMADAEHLLDHRVAEAALLPCEFGCDLNDPLDHVLRSTSADGDLQDAAAVAIAESTQLWRDRCLCLGEGSLYHQNAEAVRIVVDDGLILSSLVREPGPDVAPRFTEHLSWVNKCVFCKCLPQTAVSGRLTRQLFRPKEWI